MKIRQNDIKKYLLWLIAISTLVRGFIAAFVEFGNDEVYYWTYTLYPDWSHFDHPPMVGWMIQLFTLNLAFDSELFCRMASVLFTAVNTYIVFLIGKKIKNDTAGLFAAILYNTSLYGFVITGIFILPDTPLMLFLLLATYEFICYFDDDRRPRRLLLAGLFTGLAMISKYSAVFLWVGIGLYVLIYNREELKKPFIYIAVLISMICLVPVLIWNINNDFISFSFHGDRVGLFGEFHPEYFLKEIIGEFAYNNPINFILIIIALIAIFRRRFTMNDVGKRIILLFALPFIGIFWWFSMTRELLSHWTAPAITFLLFIVAVYLTEKQQDKDTVIIPKGIAASLFLLVFVMIIAVAEIKTGFIDLKMTEDSRSVRYRGEGDFTMDMYGWQQMKDKFEKIRDEKIHSGEMTKDDDIIALGWYPAANIDYYCATPLGINVLGFNNIQHLHKYSQITKLKGGLKKNADYWFLNDSHDYYKIENYFPKYFEEIIPTDTIAIERYGKTEKYFFVYQLKNLKEIPDFGY